MFNEVIRDMSFKTSTFIVTHHLRVQGKLASILAIAHFLQSSVFEIHGLYF